MKNWTKKYCILLAACVMLLTNACTLTEPVTNSGGNAIDAALQDGLRANGSLQRPHKNSQTLPLALQKALMPEMSMPNAPEMASEKQEQRFDIAVNNVPAKDFFMGLVKDTKYNVTINSQVAGNITIELKSVTVPQAMDAVRDNYGFEFEKTSYGYKIFPRRLETRVFNINYLDVERTGESQITVSSGQITSNSSISGSNTSGQQSGASGSVSTKSSSKFWELLKQNLETIVGTQDGRSVVLNQRSGVIIVKAYTNELRYVSQYLDSIQGIINRQVIIEAKVLEVELTAGFQNGINWKALGLFQGQAQGAGVTSAGASSSNQKPVTFLGNITGVVGLEAKGGPFSTIIQLLNSQGRVNVLSSPRIATINNQKAVIKVGNDEFYVTNVSSNINNTANSSSNTTTASITLTPFFSGISLDVTPQIDENDNITIHVHPIVSKVAEQVKEVTVNEKTQRLPLASSTVRESDSIVRAKNGQVIIIGGLMASEGNDYQESTPGADRLPGIGGLFKNSKKTARKFELVILLRPILAEDTNTWQKQLRQAADDIKKMKSDFSYNVVPEKTAKKTPKEFG